VWPKRIALAAGEQAARDIPGARLVELNGVGHIPHLEAPDEFHEALLNFLNLRK
jgi:pimeloyl-ACP methyl ester carboxylesterase